ncbi:helix-turn-helix domain-containing protein [Saccharibacillus alkalitolerans]|uniref:Helix-turn-helix transcriptional regulator n=1 Tax=Saccharibacillus alkalitolerans TaxID=2705290 RepID=A0ABX0F016_9BACL|nr:AraC family transcriptional regulator [Saccharibacillus alkalitolerans]NGZ73795.1 helix-turn-helix transcriptional regulator [Saccharibacillus alkalitolerans]
MIRLIGCGCRFAHREGIEIERPRGAGNYAFVFFRSRAEIRVDGRLEQAEPNSYILFSPSAPHAYRDLEKPFVNDWFHCEGEELDELLGQLDFPTDRLIRASDPSLVPRHMLELRRAERELGPYRDRIVDLELRGLFTKLGNALARRSVPARTDRYAEMLSRLRGELYGSPDARVSVEELAGRLNLSKSYFQHLYKELFGCSVLTDMIRGRVEYAQYLLGSTKRSVGEIGRLCGYDNETHFMRQFKQFAGMTPGAYRKSVR